MSLLHFQSNKGGSLYTPGGGGGGGTALFTDDFASGDLSKQFNGANFWRSSANASVVSNKLRINYTGSRTQAEQRFSFGANKYPEIWGKYDITIPSNWSPPNGNQKGFLTFWSNTSGSNTNDGYSQADELFMGLEFWPSGTGVNAAFRNFTAGTLDYNVHGSGPYGPKGDYKGLQIITEAMRGTTITIVMRVKYASSAPTPYVGADYYLESGGNGAFQVWVDGDLKLSDTAINAPSPGGSWSGFNRGYILGWANNGFNADTEFLIDNVEFAETDIWGVS